MPETSSCRFLAVHRDRHIFKADGVRSMGAPLFFSMPDHMARFKTDVPVLCKDFCSAEMGPLTITLGDAMKEVPLRGAGAGMEHVHASTIMYFFTNSAWHRARPPRLHQLQRMFVEDGGIGPKKAVCVSKVAALEEMLQWAVSNLSDRTAAKRVVGGETAESWT